MESCADCTVSSNRVVGYGKEGVVITSSTQAESLDLISELTNTQHVSSISVKLSHYQNDRQEHLIVEGCLSPL